MKKIFFITVLLIFGIVGFGFGQEDKPSETTVTTTTGGSSDDNDFETTDISQYFKMQIPPTPAAATFKNYSNELSVSPYTGTLNLSIPIANISSNNLSQGISLSYSTNGVSVENAKHPGRMGVGWSLCAGGVINRTVKGIVDETETYGIMYENFNIYHRIKNGQLTENDFYDDVVSNGLDTELDLFSFSFGNYSGQFYILPASQNDGNINELNIVQIPSQNLKIKPIVDYNTGYLIQFVITTEEGYRYFFEDYETTNVTSHSCIPKGAYCSAWFLSKIEDFTGNELFIFEYTPYEYTDFNEISVNYRYKLDNSVIPKWIFDSEVTSFSDFEKKTQLLTKVTGKNQYIEIDPNYFPHYIRVKNKETNKLVSEISFQYYSEGYNQLNSILFDYSEQNGYYFQYYEDEYFDSNYDVIKKAKDLWGFYNGHDNAYSCVPSFNYNGQFLNDYAMNRAPDPDSEYAKYGALKKIFYPTNGYSTIKYELNTFKTESSLAFAEVFDLYKNTNDEYYGGGIRVSEIINYSNEIEILSKKYIYTDGQLFGNPTFYYETYNYECVSSSGNYCTVKQNKYIVIEENPICDFGTHNGAFIGYSKVQEYSIDKQNNFKGFVEYSFDQSNDELLNPNNSIAINCSRENYRGFMFNKLIKDENNNPVLITETEKNNNLPYINLVYGIKIKQNYSNNTAKQTHFEGESWVSQNEYSFYNIVSEWINYPSSVTTTTYSLDDSENPNKYIETVTNYTYDNPDHAQVTSVETFNSTKDEVLITKYKYPLDYAEGINHGEFIKHMKNNNIISTPIETQTWEKNSFGEFLLSSTLQEFDFTSFDNGNTVFHPSKIYTMETDIPISRENIVENTDNGLFTEFLHNDLFNEKGYYVYDENANLVELSETDKNPTSYYWGYNNQYPIAQVINASENEIYHTSFEEVATHNIVGDAKTGDKFHQGRYMITAPEKEGIYLASYWKKEDGEWIYYDRILKNSEKIELPSGNYDEIRIYPVDALMTTYTYNYAGQVTSITDENSVTTYYKYDDFERLVRVLDHDGNILSTYEYNYANGLD